MQLQILGDDDMAKLKNTDYLFYFDVERYAAEIKKALRKATREIRELLFETIVSNIEELDFKDNEVQLAGGGITSDEERKQALLNSVKKNGHVRANIDSFDGYFGEVVMSASLSAMETNFKDSHVGWYYEIGTGEESDLEGYAKYDMPPSMGDKNPYRLPYVGAPIVSRSKREGYWRDLGGNLRSTESNIGGIGNDLPPVLSNGERMPYKQYKRLVEKFREYIGEDVKAYYWFERAVEEVSDQVLDIYKEAVLDVDIFDPKLEIFHINKKVVIGTKYEVVN